MRESVATTSILKAILAFTLLFSGFLAVAVTYNRVYKLKNETISIIEKYEGVTNKSLQIINSYLKNSGYNTKGNCEAGEYGVASLDSTSYEVAKSNKKYYYCLDYFCSDERCQIKNNNEIFFKTRLFFKFNLPFFGELFTFRIIGDTKAIKLYDVNQKLS